MSAEPFPREKPRKTRRNKRGLLIGCWRPDDVEFWDATFPDDPIDRALAIQAANEFASWSKTPHLSVWTIRNERQAFEFFFGSLQREAPEEFDKPFLERITRPNIDLFIQDLLDTNMMKSIGDILMRLYAALQLLDPGPRSRYVWLKAISEQLPGRYSPSQRRRPTLSSDDIIEKVKAAMDALKPRIAKMSLNWRPEDGSIVLRYRSLLMIATMAADPARLKNFVSHRIGVSLYKAGKNYNSYFSAEEGKTGAEAHSCRFPEDLTPYFDFYFKRVRPKIAETIDTDAVWIGRSGSALSAIGVHFILTTITVLYLGERMTAHDFRHAMVDTAVRNGHDISVARDAVGHKDNSAITESVYQGFQHSEGRRRIAANMKAIVDRVEQSRRRARS